MLCRVGEDDLALLRLEVAALALGATATQAIRPVLRRSLRSGMIPLIDSTKTTGLIFFPGTMVGMLLLSWQLALFAFALATGNSLGHSLFEIAPVTAFALHAARAAADAVCRPAPRPRRDGSHHRGTEAGADAWQGEDQPPRSPSLGPDDAIRPSSV